MTYDADKWEALAGIARSTANPIRLYLLDILMRKRYCVKELAEMLTVDISTVSRHLQQLKNSGLLDDIREGNCVYYTIRCDCVQRFFDALNSILENNIERSSRLMPGKHRTQ